MVDKIKGIPEFIKPQTQQEKKEVVKIIKKEESIAQPTISLSEEAKNVLLAQRISKTAGYLLREDKIALAKKRLATGYYADKIDEIAESILRGL